MERADKGLAFMLQYENVSWYEDGKVKILDRRIYPATVSFVICNTYGEVAQAITDMVTQSGGPYSAAAMGMALAAYECKNKNEIEQIAFLEKAACVISHARPTTQKRMELVVNAALETAKLALKDGVDVSEAIKEDAIKRNDTRYNRIAKMAENLLDLFPQNAKVLTQCFGETIVGMMLREAKTRNNDLKIFCAETRPYFQGARLTATVANQQGFETTVITDNMPAFVIQNLGIDVFTSAADAICLDGHVVNKIGTFQIAIIAKYFGIPYYVTGAPDIEHPSVATVPIEIRDPDFVLQAMGVRTADQGVKGYYPSFDITPPHLVSAVITDRGNYSPYDLKKYYQFGKS